MTGETRIPVPESSCCSRPPFLILLLLMGENPRCGMLEEMLLGGWVDKVVKCLVLLTEVIS